MRTTETYAKNVEALEKILASLSFSDESAERIRKYVRDPLSVLNDDIKKLFEKYSDSIVDYRIPLGTEMISTKQDYPDELYVVMNMASQSAFGMNPKLRGTWLDDGTYVPPIEITEDSLAHNSLTISNEKRKLWKFMASSIPYFAKLFAERITASRSFKSTIDFFEIGYGFAPLKHCFDLYVSGLGSRKTLLKTKIEELMNKSQFMIANAKELSEGEFKILVYNKVEELLKISMNIMQEIMSAKIIDANKFSFYLSFNAFDWLLASSGEKFHSCIDLNSNYCYGTGLLGMCGCPDWGMLLYTDNTPKSVLGIEALHIITRSWVWYTNEKKYQVVNWYPKDIRDTVHLEKSTNPDFSFKLSRDGSSRSFSEWDPITFFNGAVAWIYSDLNNFVITGDSKRVYFMSNGYTGIPELSKDENGIIHSGSRLMGKICGTVSSKAGSIQSFVEENYVLSHSLKYTPQYKCCYCSEEFDEMEFENADITYVDAIDDYVCSDCLNDNFIWCERCDSYVAIDDTVEVYYGSGDWQYTSYCENCASEIAFWDDRDQRYYDFDSVSHEEVQNRDGMVSVYRIFNIAEMLDNGEIFRHSDGELYTYEEEVTNEG